MSSRHLLHRPGIGRLLIVIAGTLMALGAFFPATKAQAITLTKDGLESADAASCIIDIDSLRDFTFSTNNPDVFQEKKDTSTYSTTSLKNYEVCGVYIWGTPQKGEKALTGYFELVWKNALLDNAGKRHDLHARFSDIKVNWKYAPNVGDVSQQLLRITDTAIRINAEPEALIRWDSATKSYKSRFTNAWVDGIFYALGISCKITFWNGDSTSLKYNLYAQDIDQPDRFTGNTLASCSWGGPWAESFAPGSKFSVYHVAKNTTLTTGGSAIYGTQQTDGEDEKRSGFVSLGTMAGSSNPLSFTWKGSACSTRILQDWSYVLKTRVIDGTGGTIYAKTGGKVQIKSNKKDTWNETGMVPKSSYLVTATPDSGYHISGMWLDGERVSDAEIAAGAVSLPKIAKNYYVSVMFAKDAPKTGTATLIKTSADATVTKANPCYSLQGASYGVYDDAKCTNKVGTLETDAQGKSGSLTLVAGKYYVKETKAPAGYAIDQKVHEVTVTEEKTTQVAVSDTPQGNPVDVVALKTDADLGAAKPQGSASLAGAEFTVAFYAGYHESGSLPKTATRTWVVKTDADGRAHLDKNHLVSGDDLYLFGGKPGLPLGTVSIVETKAPKGYALPKDVSPKVQQIRASGSTATVESFLVPDEKNPTASDPVQHGGVKIKKTNETGETPLAGAQFSITNASDAVVVVDGKQYKKGEVCLTIESGTDGVASTDETALPYGSYTIAETEAPKGYVVDSSWNESFSITEDGEVVDLTSRPVKNNRATVSVSLKAEKKFDGSSQGRVLEQDMFSFELLDGEGKVLQTKTNDAKGEVAFATLVFDYADAGKTYTYKIREVKGTDETIVYDSHVEEVHIALELADDGTLKATVKADDDGIVFHNQVYDPVEMPLTGQRGLQDMIPGALTALVAGGTLVGRQATKKSPRGRRRRR